MPHDLGPALALTAGMAVSMAVGLAAGLQAHKVLERHSETGRLGDTIAFVGGAFGILLGLMVVFAAEHFTRADLAAQEEAVSTVAMYHALAPFDEPSRTAVRHRLICLMRSTVADDWPATAARDMSGAESTNRWARAVQADLDDLAQDTDQRSQGYYFAVQEMLERSKARQLRLLSSQPEIPVQVWLVIFTSSVVFCGLLAFHLADRPWLLGLGFISTAIVLLALTGTLALLDYPFGWGPAVAPDAMTESMARLESMAPAGVFAPCGEPPLPD